MLFSSCGAKKKSIKIFEESPKEVKLKTSVDSTVKTITKIDSAGSKKSDIFEQKYNTEVIVKYDTLGRVTEAIYRDSGSKKSDRSTQKSKVDKSVQEKIDFSRDIQNNEKSEYKFESSDKVKLESGIRVGWVVAVFFFIILGYLKFTHRQIRLYTYICAITNTHEYQYRIP